MKLRSSTKIGIGFVVLAASAYGGYRAYTGMRIRDFVPEPIRPGAVNLIGITSKSYRIVVQNQIAHVMQGSGGDLEAPDHDAPQSDEQKRRIPMRELMQVLQGDEEALGRFVMILNELKEENLPPIRVYWEADEIQKALDGDGALRQKLVEDLNVQLDGRPLPYLRPKSIENGIVVRVKLPVEVWQMGQTRTMTATILREYRPRFVRAVERRYLDKSEVTSALRAGYYQEEATRILEGRIEAEDVEQSLRDLIDAKKLAYLTRIPEDILKSAEVIVNESSITGADYTGYQASDGKERFDLKIRLDNEGRMRLWKYSRDRVGSQILLVVNGIPIAAPRIGHELAQRELTIRQMPDEVLVREAVDKMNATEK